METRKGLMAVLLIVGICLVPESSLGQSGFELPSQEQLNKIKMVLSDELEIRESIALRSSHHKRAYYIGVNFRGKGYKSSVTGLWLIGGPKNNPNLLYSINNKAYLYSGMGKASGTKAAAYISDEESKLILRYLAK